MAKSVGARVNEKLYNWLEEKADENATTKARIIEDLLISEYKSDIEAKDTTTDGGDQLALTEVPQLRDIEENPIIEAEKLGVADEIRDAHDEWLHPDDDRRMTDVRFVQDTPEDVLRDAYERIAHGLGGSG